MNAMNRQYNIFQRICRKNLCINKPYVNYKSSIDDNLQDLCKYLKLNETKAKYLQLQHPAVKNLNSQKLKDLIGTLYELGYPRDILLEEPTLCSFLPITLKYRYFVLKECGLHSISSKHLATYLNIVKKKKIGELKANGTILPTINIENRLANYMTQWPTSLTTLVYGDVNEFTLYSLRIKIIQRYLELMLDLSLEEFERGLQTYPTIKHRPLQSINENLSILQNVVLMPKNKIKSNLYLVHADPDNLKNIIYNFKSIGGINMKDIIRMHPKLAMINCASMIETRKILEEYQVSKEAQKRCFQIYTLSPNTIRERLEKAKSIPEFNTFISHPRFLKMIHYNRTVLKRLFKLYSNNKKCSSLNVLSGSSAHYEVFEKSPGDRLGKGKDLVFYINKSLENKYSVNDIRKIIKRHPFWINIPLVQVKYVYEQLSLNYSSQDIFENCFILLYPWNKIKEVSYVLERNQNKGAFIEQIDFARLSSSQKLSLMLYLLEMNHYFSGNGVWSEENQKNIVDLTKNK